MLRATAETRYPIMSSGFFKITPYFKQAVNDLSKFDESHLERKSVERYFFWVGGKNKQWGGSCRVMIGRSVRTDVIRFLKFVQHSLLTTCFSLLYMRLQLLVIYSVSLWELGYFQNIIPCWGALYSFAQIGNIDDGWVHVCTINHMPHEL